VNRCNSVVDVVHQTVILSYMEISLMPSDEIDLFGLNFCVRIHDPLLSEWSTGQDAVEINNNNNNNVLNLILYSTFSID
jgi:hypothetical protein